MDPKEKSAQTFDSLLVLAGRNRHASDRELSRVLGYSADFVGYLKRQRKKGPSLEEALVLAEASGEPTCVVFNRLFPQPGPAELLRLLRTARREDPISRVAAPPLLAQVEEQACGALAIRHQGIRDEMPRHSPRRRLGWIDELRREDAAQGLLKIEEEIESLVVALSCAQRPDPVLVGDLAFAVALWGDIQRGRGETGLALIACPLALDLAEKSQDRWAEAHSLWMAATLAHDLGYSEYGLPWLDRACFLFSLDHRFEHTPELLVSRGLLQLALGRIEPATQALRDALARLPAAERRWRHPALLHLATAAQQVGRPEEALLQLEVLEKEYLRRDLLQGRIQCQKAAALFSLGKTAEGLASFGQAARLFSQHGRPADAVAALCNFAEYLLRERRAEKVGALAGEILVAWRAHPPSPRLAELVEDFYALARLRPLHQSDVERTRHQLNEPEFPGFLPKMHG